MYPPVDDALLRRHKEGAVPWGGGYVALHELWLRSGDAPPSLRPAEPSCESRTR